MPADTYTLQPLESFTAMIGGMPSETGQTRPDYPPPDLIPAIAPPAVAPALALASGNALGLGTYHYAVTFVNSRGETQTGPEASVTTTTGLQAVALTAIPFGPAGTTARKVYRTAVNGAGGSELLLTTIANNTTAVLTDTTPDVSLGAPRPTANGTGQLGVQIVPLAGGAPVTPRDTWLVLEELPHSGIYSKQLVAPSLTGDYAVLWDYNGGNPPFFSQTLQVDTTIPVAPPSGESLAPVYVQQADVTAYSPGLVIDDPTPGGLFDQLIVRCELEIDSILGFWIRDSKTGRKVNMTNIIPVAPISPFPGELFAPYQRGITIYQKAALQNAVCAQVEYHVMMGEEFFRQDQFDQVSGPQFSRQGRQSKIAPKARLHLAQMGLIRRVARMVI